MTVVPGLAMAFAGPDEADGFGVAVVDDAVSCADKAVVSCVDDEVSEDEVDDPVCSAMEETGADDEDSTVTVTLLPAAALVTAALVGAALVTAALEDAALVDVGLVDATVATPALSVLPQADRVSASAEMETSAAPRNARSVVLRIE
ncbi:MAG: hypothetical protein ACR2M5_09255 [Nakamurella sp.]